MKGFPHTVEEEDLRLDALNRIKRMVSLYSYPSSPKDLIRDPLSLQFLPKETVSVRGNVTLLSYVGHCQKGLLLSHLTRNIEVHFTTEEWRGAGRIGDRV